MSPAAALASTTAPPPTPAGWPGGPGGLRPGLAADLLIVNGKPLVDIGALHAVRTVVARDREVDLTPR